MKFRRSSSILAALAALVLAPLAIAQTPAEMQRMRNADAERRAAIQDQNRRAVQEAKDAPADARRAAAEQRNLQQARQQAEQRRVQQQAAKDAEASRAMARERDQDRNRIKQQASQRRAQQQGTTTQAAPAATTPRTQVTAKAKTRK